jgi:hypothetical protein
MADFLDALRTNGNVRHACRVAGIAATTAYGARDNHSGFADAWRAAIVTKAKAERGFGALEALLEPAPAPAAQPLPGKRPRQWRSVFIEALAETSNVSVAAARAGVPALTAYRLRRDDPAFAAKWLAALHEGYDHLEIELLGYLRDPAPGRKMDVAGAARILTLHRETVERRRAMESGRDDQAVFASIDAFLEGMRERRLANEAIVLEAKRDDDAE